MTENNIKLVNENGKIVGKDPETDETIPIELGETITESLSTEQADIEERDLTLGQNTSTNRDNTTVLGGDAEYDAVDASNSAEIDAVVIGTDAFADTGQSVTIGHGAESRWTDENEGDSTIAIGESASALGHSNIAIGKRASSGSTTSDAPRGVAIGRGANCEGRHSIHIGYGADDDVEGATGGSAVAIERATATRPGAIAIGQEAEATDTETVAIGRFTTAPERGSVVIGEEAASSEQDGIAIGRQINADGEDSVSIGAASQTLGLEAVALGRSAEAGEESVAIGGRSDAIPSGSVAIGKDAQITSSENAKAVVTVGADRVLEIDGNGNLQILGELTENADL